MFTAVFEKSEAAVFLFQKRLIFYFITSESAGKKWNNGEKIISGNKSQKGDGIMKFWTVVTITVLSVFMLMFFGGLSLGTDTTSPSKGAFTFKVLDNTFKAVGWGKKGFNFLLLKLDEGIETVSRGIVKTSKDLKDFNKDTDVKDGVYKASSEEVKSVKESKKSKEYGDSKVISSVPEVKRSVEVNYHLIQGGQVVVKIYDNQNQLVEILEDSHDKGGTYSVAWDGQDLRGKPVISGNYAYQVYTYKKGTPLLFYSGRVTTNRNTLEDQLNYLAEKGYNTIYPQEIKDDSQQSQDKEVVLAFNQGINSFYSNVFPLLREKQLKAALYLPEKQRLMMAQVFENKGLLRVGSKGFKVRELQERMTQLGYMLMADGIYGLSTRSAVLSFQKRYNLLVDGIVGPQTTGEINRLTKKYLELEASGLVKIQTKPFGAQKKITVPEQASLELFTQLLQQGDMNSLDKGVLKLGD